MTTTQCDVVIIGGGPAGAVAALELARAGRDVVIVERTKFPRFHVGESMLPGMMPLFRELGLAESLDELPHVKKRGAEFGFGHGNAVTRFPFTTSLVNGDTTTFNIERAPFDQFMLDHAIAAGARLYEGQGVSSIRQLKDGAVEVESDGEVIQAKYLLDASGQGTVIGRHLGTRRRFDEPYFRKVAYFGHFTGVERLPGDEEGYPTIVMADEGWFWIIPIDDTRTSLGMVFDADLARTMDVPADQMLRWGIERCPIMANRTRNAVFPDSNGVTSDYSYTCAPFAGPGYFLIGDAATFLDPIFSSGVHLALHSALNAARGVDGVLEGRVEPAAARRRHERFIQDGSRPFFKLIRMYYQHSFRELFVHGTGPLQVHRAIIALLAGHGYPQPSWALRWRLGLMQACVALNKWLPLVPRCRRHSLMEAG